MGPRRAIPVNREGCSGAVCTNRSDPAYHPDVFGGIGGDAGQGLQRRSCLLVGVHAVPFQCSIKER
jgi:hypothetical protein